ncbi:DNA translocase FtsK [Thermodesulforhabdus norvegica]|uniref:DNA segregation ATPase FtsK/SpoIIIE, S-DNA-T family n=1 Tax=Thermodesulforhabdus norvegica TaxID=39841 RepID=A0A1I4VAA0_9BACT|nr:DNA translocase FtsK [Thermodesulforhabdus norvegica]SFM98115.1 DNA segregation ATPase FtsK/SpoIIIE, S-DNA-T family [Thermodesulforhabdus norvegica]
MMKRGELEAKKPREILGLSVCFLGILLSASFLSYHPHDPTVFNASSGNAGVHNVLGLFGAHVAYLFMHSFGIASFLVPFCLIWSGFRIIVPRRTASHISGKTGLAVALLAFFVLLLLPPLIHPTVNIHAASVPISGVLGALMVNFLERFFSRLGAIILISGLSVITFFALVPATFEECLKACGNSCRFLGCRIKKLFSGFSDSFRTVIKKVRLTKKQSGNRSDKHSPQVVPLNEENPDDLLILTDDDVHNGNAKNGDEEIRAKGEAIFSSAPPIIPRSSEKKSSSSFKSSPPRQNIKFSGSTAFSYPPVDLLNEYPQTGGRDDDSVLKEKASVLKQKLADFGIQGEVVAVHPGPVITMFEYVPAPGIKISRIVNLQNDLTMALKALSVRIVAPIPGKAAVGIEIPNKKRQLVAIRDIIDSEAFKNARAPLTIALGKNIVGETVITNLAKMPHLLIAGATGTGKSVCLNAILTSLLYRNGPDTLRLMLIDPKRIELSFYEDIPHLIHPVVKDAKKANQALKWAVSEMERRYELMAEVNARNIESYNQAIRKKEDSSGYEQMPYIVIVIDELADLMMVASREVEESVTRLAQMARAAGMHLILATQRPSVDVITGLIKANIPSRISFQVSSKVDSRTILDAPGAETLLGAGDMLFLPPGTAKLQRIHGAFVSEEEVKKVVDFWKAQAEAVGWSQEYVCIEEPRSTSGFDEDEIDEKYEEAVRLVLQTRQASISMLQRRLRVGYNRAARMIEMMEQQGIVGPSDGIKPREVLLPPPENSENG